MNVNQIFVFPFKSLKGIELDECEIDEFGVRHDRIYMLVQQDAKGKWSALTQRQEPKMALIETKISGSELILQYKSSKVSLPLDPSAFDNDSNPTIEMELWDYSMKCKQIISAVDNLAKFFTDFLRDCSSGAAKNAVAEVVDGVATKIGVVASSQRREVPQTVLSTPITSNFQDLWPVSLMTTASFEDLQRHVGASDESARISPDSFRMNFTVETEEPWEEDDWRELTIGGHEFKFVCYCDRCSMPAVDQALGEVRQGRHPLPSLSNFRVLEKGHTPAFGINITQTKPGFTIRKGDAVVVTKQE